METEKPAAVICEALVLSGEARALLTPEQEPPTFLALLEQHHLWPDALRFLAFALPPRHAVWWACLCVRHSLGISMAERAALRAAVELVREPSDERKKACEAAARQATLNTPAGFVATAASRWDVPKLRPGRPAGAAVLMSATRCRPASQYFRAFLGIGLDVDAGKLPWTSDLEPSLT